MNVAIIGLGLIGGSIAKGLSRAGHRVIGWDRDPIVNALAGQSIEIGRPDDPEVLIVAVSINQRDETVETALETQAALITDTGSFLSSLEHPRYIPGHPMAGRAHGGWAAASAELFQGATWALTRNSEQLEALISDLGARPHIVDSKSHNHFVGKYSHLPQLIATVLASEQDGGLELSGTAYRDMTRIAASPPEMWVEIISANYPEIIPALEQFITGLQLVHDQLSEQDWEAIGQLIEAGNKGREELIETRWSSES
jgi:prephenate dehydrogenase